MYMFGWLELYHTGKIFARGLTGSCWLILIEKHFVLRLTIFCLNSFLMLSLKTPTQTVR